MTVRVRAPLSADTDTIAQAAHGFSLGDVVRWDGGQWVLAQADSLEHAGDGVRAGVVDAPVDDDTFALRNRGRMSWQHGLAVNTEAYLSDETPGALVTEAPAIMLPIGVTTSPGTFDVDIRTGAEV